MADGCSLPPEVPFGNPTRTLKVGDLFCGAGGLSTGATRAIRELGHVVAVLAQPR